jgi:anti-sigma factor RsiW
MNCKMFVSLIDDFVDSTLPSTDRQRMEEHLRTCSNCRKELEDLQSLLARSAELSEKPQRDLAADPVKSMLERPQIASRPGGR